MIITYTFLPNILLRVTPTAKRNTYSVATPYYIYTQGRGAARLNPGLGNRNSYRVAAGCGLSPPLDHMYPLKPLHPTPRSALSSPHLLQHTPSPAPSSPRLHLPTPTPTPSSPRLHLPTTPPTLSSPRLHLPTTPPAPSSPRLLQPTPTPTPSSPRLHHTA